jgi:acylphosphatase
MEKRLHIIVSGRVQGVWFRASTQVQARQLGLVGQVWNRSDGRVEIIVEGTEEVLLQFFKWCGVGPAGARVDNLESDWSASIGEFSGFDIV